MAYGVGTDYFHGERMDPPESREDWEAEEREENGEEEEGDERAPDFIHG
jgi:hypothetical protein